MHARVAPKTNISKAYYKHIVDEIEHDPLIKHSTLSVACFLAAIAILAGAILWFAKSNPGNLIQTSATVSVLSSGKTDALGGTTTFVTFNFTACPPGHVESTPADFSPECQKSVRQLALSGVNYQIGQSIKVGYHPKNSNYARLLNDNKPPMAALVLWTIPCVLMIWLLFVAMFRHHARQVEIWNAAEAANSDD